MAIKLYDDYCDKRWDEYVMASDESSVYHLRRWKKVIEKSFGHKTFYLMAENGKGIEGILPLTLFSSKVFGRFIVSLPFFNYGGICAENKEVMESLLEEAINIAKKEKAKHLELRHLQKPELPLPTKETKVTLILELTDKTDDIWNGLDAKVRNQVRKARKAGLRVEIKEGEALAEFYKVFAINMRDLGTPVYSRAFFKNILAEFPQNTKIFILYLDDKVVAASLTVGFKDTLEAPWAASLKEYRPLCPNMLLYWSMIEYACQNGYRKFDFGRSSWLSATFKFKRQWGAIPKQLYWQYWLRNGDKLPQINPDNPKYRFAVKVWQKMPVSITKILGPHIVKNIP